MAVQNILDQLKKFSFFETFKHTSTYFSGTILVHMLGIVTLPVFTAYLTPDEYGIVNVFTTYISVVAVLLSLSLHSSIARYYFEEDKVDFKEFLGSIFITISFLFLIQGGLVLFFKEKIARPFNYLVGFYHLLNCCLFFLLSNIGRNKRKQKVCNDTSCLAIREIWMYNAWLDLFFKCHLFRRKCRNELYFHG